MQEADVFKIEEKCVLLKVWVNDHWNYLPRKMMDYSLLKTLTQNWISFQKLNFSHINYWIQYRDNKLNYYGCVVQKISFLSCK